MSRAHAKQAPGEAGINGTATAWVVSCEHATNHIPPPWQHLFDDAELLQSHRGWDPGAAGLARYLGRHLDAPVFLGKVSRLLADNNRSAGHPKVHAPAVRALPKSEREAIIRAWHAPHQHGVIEAVGAALAGADRVLHISCHSFTPELNGHVRTADIGVLYDPRHDGEAELAHRWKQALLASSDLRVRRNYPYTGHEDGMTRILRRRFGTRVLGFELELNQALLQRGEFSSSLLETLLKSLRRAAEVD
ncbi:MAG: N-formylglutamate amidohydrolase [Gammaproteobacteria bacterium]|nr:N-formylglutamate amidohydrolase [Gammaproteobacteria bacterium]